MEVLAKKDEHFGDLNAGTASDHWELGWAHLRRSLQLTFCGSSRPAEGVDVSIPNEYEDDDEQKLPTNGVFLPTQSWKEFWDLVVLVFILYSAVMVPYRICFNSPAQGMWFIVEQMVTFTFIIDVFFNFNTAYMDDERWVIKRSSIACRYMQGWFWIDAPSAIPVELIDLYFEGDSSSFGMLRFLRLFRLLRLLRLLKVGEYVAALEIRFDLNLTFLRIAQMLLQLLFLAHMLGCFWFYIAAFKGIDADIVTWVSSYDDGSAVDAPADVQYLYAVYWALTTLTTVGYGDITPTNNLERTYSLFALLLGALVFGYMLSTIGTLVSAIDKQAALSEEKMDEIKEYMRWRRLPRDLVIRMRRYYTYYYSRKTAFDEESILQGLTPGLRLEIVKHSLKETIGKIPLFNKILHPEFQLEVFHLFKPLSAAPREVIFSKGDQPDGLLFLLKGSVEVISGYDGRVLYRVRQGQHFGEEVLTGKRRVATHRAASACEMFLISSEHLTDLFQKRPFEGKLIHSSVLREHLRKERMRYLSLRLLRNKLEKSSGRDAQHHAAALTCQMAWSKYLDRVYNPSLSLEVPSLPERDRIKSMTPAASLAADAPPSPTVTSTVTAGASMDRRLEKLERIDHLVAKVEHLIDKVDKFTPPRSGGPRK